jgi:hypothetical protein
MSDFFNRIHGIHEIFPWLRIHVATNFLYLRVGINQVHLEFDMLWVRDVINRNWNMLWIWDNSDGGIFIDNPLFGFAYVDDFPYDQNWTLRLLCFGIYITQAG